MKDLKTLLEQGPEFHVDERGEPISWAIGDDVLQFISENVRPGDRTMETGSGMSTVVFTNAQCRHTVIAPSKEEFDKIREFCRRNSIGHDRTVFFQGFSETALPQLIESDPLDLFLVDGRHAFPSPFIDWYYASRMLRVGGLMIVDDTQLYTGKVLQEFMHEDDHWESVVDFAKTCVFRKVLANPHLVEWNQQPYVLSRQ